MHATAIIAIIKGQKEDLSAMLLVLDVGNTHIKMGIYNGDSLSFQARLSTDRFKTADEYAVEFYTVFQVYKVPAGKITGVIIGSVVPQITKN